MLYTIEATKKTPSISFKEKEIFISGSSVEESPVEFYEELNTHFEVALKGGFTPDRIIVRLDYINTSSLKRFITFIKKVLVHCPNASIVWHYANDDEDMMEIGKLLAQMLDISITFESFDA